MAIKAAEPMSTDEQIKVLKNSERVQKVSTQILDLVAEETKDLRGDERWLMCGRILGCVFQFHFNLSMETAGKDCERVDTNLKTIAPPVDVI